MPHVAYLACFNLMCESFLVVGNRIQMYDYRKEANSVATPREAGNIIHSKLAPLFQGFYFTVTSDRGIGVEFARMSSDDYIKRQWRNDPTLPDSNMRCVVIIAPSTLGFGAWQDLNVGFGGTSDEIKDLKSRGVSIRRASGLTPEAAVASVIKWFEKNAAKLKG